MGPLNLALTSVHWHLERAWSAPSRAAPSTAAEALLVLPLIQLGIWMNRYVLYQPSSTTIHFTADFLVMIESFENR